MEQRLYEALQRNPIIAAVRDDEGLAQCLRTDIQTVFVLYGDICNISEIVRQIKDAGKIAIVHADLISGLAAKEISVDFLRRSTQADGVISTRANMIQRAKELVEELSDADITAAVKDLTAPKKKQKISYDQVDMAQMSLFDTVTDEDVLNELKELDVSTLTPLDALNTIYRLQNKLKNRW